MMQDSYGRDDLRIWSSTSTGILLACIGYIVLFAALGIRWLRWEVR
jgi:hypothetical protein